MAVPARRAVAPPGFDPVRTPATHDADQGYGDPSYGDPSYGDPSYGDPSYGDPAHADPAHIELARANSYYQAVITASPDAIHIYDVDTGELSRANLLAPAFIGYTDETVAVMSGQLVDRLVPLEDLRRWEQALTQARALPNGQVTQLVHRVLHGDNPPHWVSRRLTPFRRDETGQVREVLVVTRDVTEAVEMEERLAHAATHDELTGLPNRRAVRDHLTRRLAEPDVSGRVVAMVCDLDTFKRINDSHGHQTGDTLLMETAARLTKVTRPGDLVARMGGDEFVVILELGSGESPDTVADALASRIENAICQPIVVGSKEHLITVSIGYAVAGDDATADSLLGDADTAMYHVKSHGANGHRAFDPSLRRDTAHHDHTERQIRRALADGTLEVHYQPIVNPVTRLVHGVEALLRIPDANGMHLNTAEVIAVAEKTGLVSAIDDRVLEIASAQVASWHRDATLGPLMLTLNRSVRDITKPGFYDRIQHVLALSGLSPQALTLEITETVLLDADRAALTDLYDLHAQGINIAIDDFGTGYASLSYLTTLPISCIKIDRSFTDGLPADPTCATLVRATVGIAEDLGIDCVVEGVETPAQLASLPHYERLLVQGYLFGRPQPASQLAALLSAGGRLDAIA